MPGAYTGVMRRVDTKLDPEIGALDEVLRRMRSGDHDEARRLLDTAIGRWNGPALAGYADEDWLIPNRPRRRDLDGSAEYAYFTALAEDLRTRHGLNPE